MFDITTASLRELKQHRDDVTTRIEEMEREALEDVVEKAAALGYELIPAQPVKQKRNRRTKEEMETARANGHAQ
jgi:hypothetical protein